MHRSVNWIDTQESGRKPFTVVPDRITTGSAAAASASATKVKYLNINASNRSIEWTV
jgi:hypothetical protein